MLDDFNKGDRVVLVAEVHSPEMAVEAVDPGRVFCVWFDAEGSVQRAHFAPEVLRVVASAKS